MEFRMRKRGPEKDIDGRIPFKPGGMKQPTKFAIVSVKGGKLKADDVRALASIAHNEKATSLIWHTRNFTEANEGHASGCRPRRGCRLIGEEIASFP